MDARNEGPPGIGDGRRRMLFIAYYFPPEASSGVHRAINFVRYLPASGWLPTVLTIRASDFPSDANLDARLLDRIPQDVRIVRARVIKLLQHWTFPDNKLAWLPAAVAAGWRLSRERKFDAVFVTGSPWSSLVIAYVLTRLTRTPLILDFRDPWARNPYRAIKPSWLRRALERRFEARIVRAAAGIVLNTPALHQAFVNDYPDVPAERFMTVTNGYEPSLVPLAAPARNRPGELTITHAGHVYARRSPDALLDAVQRLRDSGRLGATRLRIRFVGSSDVDLHAKVRARDLEEWVELIPPVGHEAAMKYLVASDVLLILQSGTQLQIPAKLYEYMALGRPMLALTDSASIASMVLNHNLGWVCAPDSPADIADRLAALLDEHQRGAPEPRLAPPAFRVDRIVERLSAFCDRMVPPARTTG